MTDASKPDDTAADQGALDHLEAQEEKTRRAAEDAGILHDDDTQEFADSGTIRPDLDDQTIAPPG